MEIYADYALITPSKTTRSSRCDDDGYNSALW